MKKGFTMVELLAVFTLLGIILVITLPQITSSLKKSNSESYDSFTKNISLATEAYITDNNIVIAKSSSKTIYIKEIIESGYLNSSLKNPKNNHKLSDMNLTKARVLVKKDSNGILTYEFYES